MPRSIEEIDADIAAVQQQIAMRNALGYKHARARAILDHDVSSLDRIYSAMNAAEQNRIARDAQQQFQTAEREATQKFQAEQNDLNRGLQALQFANAREEAKAKAFQLLKDAYTMRDTLPLLADEKTIKNADSALAFALKHAKNQGITDEELAGFSYDPTSETQSSKTADAVAFRTNNIIKGNETRKDLEEKRKYLEGHIQKYGNDPSAKLAEQTLKLINDKISKEDDAEDAETEKQFQDTLKNIGLKGNREKASELVKKMHNPYRRATLETALENSKKRRGVKRERAKVDFTK